MQEAIDTHVDIDSGPPLRLGDVARSAVAIAILLAVLLTFAPFSDLSDPKVTELSSGNEAFSYLCLIFLALAATALLASRVRLLVAVLATPEYVLLLGWLWVSVVMSVDPGTSARRLVLACTTFALAALLPWLATGYRQFTTFLMIAAGVVLTLSYFGVVIVPELTIHQATDLVEPEIAGDWRGVFGHKNIAANLMAVFVYIGWFMARGARPRTGVTILVAALVFLVFTHGKSALGLLLTVAAIGFAVDRARSLVLKSVVALAPLGLLNLLTVGSATSDFLHSAVSLLPIDATFTGRADIWRFAIDAIRERFWFGHGFEAFWYTAGLRYGDDSSMRWMADIASSHNSYVDLVLTIGMPGLVVVIIAFVLLPLRDYHRTLAATANRELAGLFLVLWLFSLYSGTFEVFFLNRANPMWFMMALAMCGLRYTSRYEIRD